MSPSDLPLLLFYLASFCACAAKACFAGVALARLLPRLSTWNRACRRSTGASLPRLIFSDGPPHPADPGILGAFALACLCIGAAAAARAASGGVADDAIALAAGPWTLSQSGGPWVDRMGWLSIQATEASLFGAAPVAMLRWSLSNPASPVAALLMEQREAERGEALARSESAELAQSIPARPARPRRARRL